MGNFFVSWFETIRAFLRGSSMYRDVSFSTAEFLAVTAMIIAVAATVLAFIFIVPAKKRARLNTFFKFLHDILNFKVLIIEKILQALYILATSLCIVTGVLSLFGMSFYEEYGWHGSYTKMDWAGGRGLLLLILGPIIVRIVYEALMLALILIKNVIQINNKIEDPEGKKDDNPFTSSMPSVKDFIPKNPRPAKPKVKPQPAQPQAYQPQPAQPQAYQQPVAPQPQAYQQPVAPQPQAYQQPAQPQAYQPQPAQPQAYQQPTVPQNANPAAPPVTPAPPYNPFNNN